MKIPASTYRVQLNKDFTLQHLAGILDYLKMLGITTVYAAPVLRSKPGSMHGYDVIDPHIIDPEIGTIRELEKISQRLKEMDISWLQDIVPNHMAFDVQNMRLMDVLERGSSSPYYTYFDIDWSHHSSILKGKLAVPFLGNELSECLAKGELKISFSEKGFTVDYFETQYPLSLSAMNFLKTDKLESVFNDFIEKAKALPELDRWSEFKKNWAANLLKDEKLKTFIREQCDVVNKNLEKLNELLQAQFYVMMYWKRSEQEINYRRFFTVNELICLRMEDQKVFEEYHAYITDLYRKGLIHGLRIDHIDGLYDPAGYVSALRKLLGEDCYIIAEKILEAKETMPEHWPLQGTSGYEFLSYVSQLITDKQGAQKLVTLYKELIPDLIPYQKLVFENKKLILENYMAGEWDNLTRYFKSLNLSNGFGEERIKQALALFMISLPVYRIYPESLPLPDSDVLILKEAFQKAAINGPDYKEELTYLEDLFTSNPENQKNSSNVLRFLKRVMQFTGPLTAKGVEDTTFYVYNPLISHDEVGDAPSTLGITIQAFHSRMSKRQKTIPLSLNATATHDTKRGEDSRLRLNVLSEMVDDWEQYVKQWFEMNAPFKKNIGDKIAPSLNDEYFIYQSLLGGFPEDLRVTGDFKSRFEQFLVKALREAKVHSNWSNPDLEYERACIDFVDVIFEHNPTFKESFSSFAEMVIRYANFYALGQVLIKITTPGIPDTYQGCELWDLSFVDPDNRRPVDYAGRKEILEQIIEKEKEGPIKFFHFLKTKRKDGYEKLFVTWKALNFRKQHAELFHLGEYIPLQVTGKQTVIVAYARSHKSTWALVIIPLAIARNRELDQPYANDPDEKKYIILPFDAPKRWTNVITGDIVETTDRLYVFEAFKDFPVALFTNS